MHETSTYHLIRHIKRKSHAKINSRTRVKNHTKTKSYALEDNDE